MKPLSKRLWILLALALALAGLGCCLNWPRVQNTAHRFVHPGPGRQRVPPEQRTADHMRVLFIGNSITRMNGGLDVILEQLAQSTHPDRPAIADCVIMEGGTLAMQLRFPGALQRIREGHWDYVVLQEFSTRALDDLEETIRSVKTFDAEIRKVGAHTLVMANWSNKYRAQDEDQLEAAYQQIGQQDHVDVVPVEAAWKLVQQRRGDLAIYVDEKHPNANGSYLTACVFYSWIYGRTPLGATTKFDIPMIPTPMEIAAGDADFLQRAASATVAAVKPFDAPAELAIDLGHGVKLEMVKIPAGSFNMGSPDSEDGHSDCESPQHRVTLAHPFYLGKFAITQRQFIEITGRNQSNATGDPNLPAEQVSYGDCLDFCKTVALRTGRVVRLPSEAEWEYACRAGTDTPFNTGNDLSSEQANFDGSDPGGNATTGPSRGKTLPVGSFKPNAWGLYDMHGNVAQWCLDRFHNDYTGAPVDGSAWLSGDNPNFVFRGGSFNNAASSCRSAFRSATNGTEMRTQTLGFRVALDIEPQP